jgi:hypothetical protein
MVYVTIYAQWDTKKNQWDNKRTQESYFDLLDKLTDKELQYISNNTES